MQGIINKLLWLAFGGGVLVVLDQLAKALIWAARAPEAAKNISRYWWLTWHQNYGISLGIELPYYLSVSLMAAFLLLLLWLLFQRNTRDPLMVAGLILSLAGGTSNLIDRINLGFVRDFVALSPWLPIFNLADILVVGGVVLILVETYRHAR